MAERNWSATRLAIKIGGTTIPARDFQYNLAKVLQRIHLLHRGNAGVHSSPLEIDFTLRMVDIGEELKEVTRLLLDNQFFDMVLGRLEGGQEWTYDALGFNKCRLGREQVTNVNIENLHEVNISGICMEFDHDGQVYSEF